MQFLSQPLIRYIKLQFPNNQHLGGNSMNASEFTDITIIGQHIDTLQDLNNAQQDSTVLLQKVNDIVLQNDNDDLNELDDMNMLNEIDNEQIWI